MTEITIVSSDGKNLKAKLEAMKISKPFEVFYTDNKPEVPIPISHPSGALEKIIAFCEQFMGKPIPKFDKPIHANKLEGVIKDEFVCKLLDIPTDKLFELLMASDFLVLKEFEDLVACAVAVKLVGKSTDDIRKEFGIVNDFTPAEVKSIDEFFAWSQEIWP